MKTFSQFVEQSTGGSPYQPYKVPIPSPPPPGFREKYIDPLKKKTQTESKAAQDIESSRYEDDVYRTTQQKLADPRLRKLRRFFNREVGRYTV